MGSRGGFKKSNCLLLYAEKLKKKKKILFIDWFYWFSVKWVCLHKTSPNTRMHQTSQKHQPISEECQALMGKTWVVNKMNKWALISIWKTHRCWHQSVWFMSHGVHVHISQIANKEEKRKSVWSYMHMHLLSQHRHHCLRGDTITLLTSLE